MWGSFLLINNIQPWARICERLRSPRIDSKESIPPGWASIPGLDKMFSNTGSEPVFVNVKKKSPGINSEESIPPAYVACRAGTKTLFLLGA